MLKYLVILLDDTATSYCHYSNRKEKRNPISLEKLEAGIIFAMKENLQIQFVYPDYPLPQEHLAKIRQTRHTDIAPAGQGNKADVTVIEGWEQWNDLKPIKEDIYVIRTSKQEFFEHYNLLKGLLDKAARVNVVITDIETFSNHDFDIYKHVLQELSKEITEMYTNGCSPQLNLLTDRLLLNRMCNCNAGWESVTLAPDGKFYICPAFYQENEDAVGDLSIGLNIKNPQLYRLDHAPLCRNCDAYQCKRCVYLNRKTTLEINVPSHEQCVTAHLERNASRFLLTELRKRIPHYMPDIDIKEITYNDPFEVRKEYHE